jgi:ribosomal protein S18 acetylase RimI-like enzyme
VKLRTATAADAAGIYEVHVSAGGSIPWDSADECREHIQRMTRQGNPPIVADVGGEVVGAMEIWWGQDVPQLGRSLDVSMIDVRADHQRRGVGSALLRHAMCRSRQEGCDCVSVWADRNAIGFYRKHGFAERLLLRRFRLPVPSVPARRRLDLQPVELARLGAPDPAHLRTWRLVHPRQLWQDLSRQQAEPPVWQGGREPRRAIFARRIGLPGHRQAALGVYRLAYWKPDAQTAGLYLWTPAPEADVLRCCIGHAAFLGVSTLTILAYGRTAEQLAELGGIAEGQEHVLFRPNPLGEGSRQ